jgi:hypothetical protein
MTAALETRHVEAGDIVETTGRHVGDVGRRGEIVAVLGDKDHFHYRVRWEDGHESILYPGEGTTIRPRDSKVGWAD